MRNTMPLLIKAVHLEAGLRYRFIFAKKTRALSMTP